MSQKSPTDLLNDPKVVQAVTDSGTGGLLGFATGYALKKVGKVAVFAVGAGFVATQYLANQGVIDVNWSLIDREVKRNLDLNKDGVVDIKDLAVAAQDANNYFSRGLPFGGGFGVGFFAGLKSG